LKYRTIRLNVTGVSRKLRNPKLRTNLTLALALQARQRIAAGRPPIVVYTLTSRSSLGALCQRLYGSRGREIAAEIQRANRIRRPFAIDAGTVLLLPDPAAVV